MAGRFVVIGSVQGKLSWIDVESGQLKYQYALDPGYCFSSPAATPRMTYITSMNGTVDAILLP
jgi:hypothetical protein